MKLWVDSVLLEKQYFNNRLVSWHFLLFPVYFVCVKSSVLADCFNKYHSCLQVLLKLMSLKVALPKVSNLQFLYSQGSIWFFFFKRGVFCLMSLKCCFHTYTAQQHISHLKGKETKQYPTLPTKGEYTSLPNAVHFGDASTPSRTTENSLASTSWPAVFVSFTETSWNVSDQRKNLLPKNFCKQLYACPL